jgi:hypothetical protein
MGPLGPRSNLTRTSGFFGSRVCHASRDPDPVVQPHSTVTLRIDNITTSNASIVTPGPAFLHSPVVPVCPSPRQDQHKLPAGPTGAARAVVFWPGLNCADGGMRVCTSIHRRHRGIGNNRNEATAATAATLVAGRKKRLQKKEAGTAGGESGARAHGPALGGEAGSVLIGSLSAKCPRMRPPVPDFPATGGVSATGTRCSVSPNRITTYAEGSEKGLSLTLLTPW